MNIDGLTGFVCPIGDVEQMAEKAIYLLSNEKELMKFSHAAKQKALTFDKKAILPQYEQIYLNALEKANH